MKKFHGIEVFEAIALYSGLKVHRTDPVTGKDQVIDTFEALNLLSKSPDQIWAEIEESEIDKIHKIRKELLEYVNDSTQQLNPDSVLYAAMLIGNYELFHTQSKH